MILLNAPVHGPYRQQFTGLMKRDLLEQFRERVRAIAERTVREARALGYADGVDHCAAPASTAFVCDYLRIVPKTAIMSGASPQSSWATPSAGWGGKCRRHSPGRKRRPRGAGNGLRDGPRWT